MVRPPRRGGRGGITVGTLIFIMLRLPVIGIAPNIPFTFIPLNGAFVAGRVLRRRCSRHLALATRAERLEADGEAQIAATLKDERNRIARELHDIVAHCVSVMVVQAGVAEDLVDRAREPLRAVQETGRQAVAELGRMLGLLRGGGRRPFRTSPRSRARRSSGPGRPDVGSRAPRAADRCR